MKTHYDVLNLDKNCSPKEIKDSFIKLSKKYHPDKNKSSDAHRKFVEVNEAYSVLGKPSSRYMYDETLSHREKPRTVHTTNAYRPGTTMKTPYEYYTEMYAKKRSQVSNQGYFTRSKLYAVCLCFIIMAIGSGAQIMAESHRRSMRSHRIATMLKESRDRRIRQELRQKQQEMYKNETSNFNPGEQ